MKRWLPLICLLAAGCDVTVNPDALKRDAAAPSPAVNAELSAKVTALEARLALLEKRLAANPKAASPLPVVKPVPTPRNYTEKASLVLAARDPGPRSHLMRIVHFLEKGTLSDAEWRSPSVQAAVPILTGTLGEAAIKTLGADGDEQWIRDNLTPRQAIWMLTDYGAPTLNQLRSGEIEPQKFQDLYMTLGDHPLVVAAAVALVPPDQVAQLAKAMKANDAIADRKRD